LLIIRTNGQFRLILVMIFKTRIKKNINNQNKQNLKEDLDKIIILK